MPAILLAMPESARLERALSSQGNAVVRWGSVLIAMMGILLRCATVAFAPDGTSSRDTRALRAPSLNVTGMYSLMRHPLYTGNALMWIGVAMSTRVWWLVLIVGLAYALYIERVMAFEETFLEQSFGDQFCRWAAETQAFVPRWSGWRPAQGPFAWRRVASEHNGLLAIAVAFPLLQLGSLGGGVTLAEWSLKHDGLLMLLVIAMIVSSVAIIARRWPPQQESRINASD